MAGELHVPNEVSEDGWLFLRMMTDAYEAYACLVELHAHSKSAFIAHDSSNACREHVVLQRPLSRENHDTPEYVKQSKRTWTLETFGTSSLRMNST